MSGAAKELPFPINRQIDSIVPYVPGKPTEELERELGLTGTVKLASNENPLGPSPLAVRAMKEAAAGANRYPDGGAFYLKEKLARRLGVDPGQIILGNGSTEIVEMLAKAFLPPDGESLVSAGAFIMYRIASLAAAATAREVPMTTDLRHDLTAMAAAVGERTRLVFVANPNNPTGTRVGRAEMDDYFTRVPERVLTVVDEAYREYNNDPDHPDATEALGEGKNVVVLRTFSKIHGLAGARIGYGISHRSVIEALEKVRSPFNTNTIGQAGALAALDDEAHIRRSQEENRRELLGLQAALEERHLAFAPSFANFVLMAPGLPGSEAFTALLERGVIVRPVAPYGFPDHLRVSVGTRDENQKFLTALDESRWERGRPSA